jgi:DNA-binding MarR family transcriptional regulator
LSAAIADDNDPSLEVVDLPMSRIDIADFLGLKKETVSRSLTQLEQKGLIQRQGSERVRITDLENLRELAGVLDFASPLRLPSGHSDKTPL